MISKTYKITEINKAIDHVRNNKLTCKETLITTLNKNICVLFLA